MAVEPVDAEEPPRDGERELRIARVLDAPAAMVFHCWLDPEHMASWWVPAGFTVTSQSWEVRPGGRWRTCIRSDDYGDLWSQGDYREIVPEERIVYTWAWENEDGTPGHETLLTVDFTEEDGKTFLSFHQGPFESVDERDAQREAWSEAFDRLAEHVERERSAAPELEGLEPTPQRR